MGLRLTAQQICNSCQSHAGTHTPHRFPPKRMVHGGGGARVTLHWHPSTPLHSFICFPLHTFVLLSYSFIPLHPLPFPTLYLPLLRSVILLSSGSLCFPHFPSLSRSFTFYLPTHPSLLAFFTCIIFPSLPLSSEVSLLFISLQIRT